MPTDATLTARDVVRYDRMVAYLRSVRDALPMRKARLGAVLTDAIDALSDEARSTECAMAERVEFWLAALPEVAGEAVAC